MARRTHGLAVQVTVVGIPLRPMGGTIRDSSSCPYCGKDIKPRGMATHQKWCKPKHDDVRNAAEPDPE